MEAEFLLIGMGMEIKEMMLEWKVLSSLHATSFKPYMHSDVIYVILEREALYLVVAGLGVLGRQWNESKEGREFNLLN